MIVSSARSSVKKRQLAALKDVKKMKKGAVNKLPALLLSPSKQVKARTKQNFPSNKEFLALPASHPYGSLTKIALRKEKDSNRSK